jgi:hypothetical protein
MFKKFRKKINKIENLNNYKTISKSFNYTSNFIS